MTVLKDDDSDWVFTYGGSAGLVIPLTPHVDLDLGYRYIHLDGDEYEIAGTEFTTTASSAHVLYLGVGFSF